MAGQQERQAAANAEGAGFDNTIRNTGGEQGLADAPTGRKQLTGQ